MSFRGIKLEAFASLLVLASLLLPTSLRAQANPFRDVPEDHWSLAAVRRLASEGLVEGFPDGTFKGKKVVTRYDMAIHLAKLLAKVDTIRAQGRAGISPEDAVTVTRLTNEYKQELDLLGVKVDALEQRIGVVERSTQKLEKDLSNVRIEGIYKINTYFVDEPFDFTNYPFSAGRNPYNRFGRSGPFPGQFNSSGGGEQSGDTDTNRTGLQPIEHEVFLRFLGNPFALDGLNKDIETFLEIKGVLNGPAENRLAYRFSDPPQAGDNLDDFATSVIDDKRVSVNRAHMIVNSKRLRLRVFSEEAITSFDGPMALLTTEGVEKFSPEQGVEANGDYKKLSYRAAILKDFKVSSSDGFNRGDLFEEFAPETVTDKDAFGLRLAYFTSPEETKNRLLFGGSYVEHVTGYEKANDFNRVLGADVIWEHRSATTLDAGLSYANTVGPGDKQGAGTVFDLDVERSRWKILGKFYSFDRKYRANLAEKPWVDTGSAVNTNFRRPGGFEARVAGERLFRTQIKYEADDTLLRSVEALTFNLLYEQKWWESDPEKAADIDGNTARRLSLQTIADLTDRTHVELKNEYIKDVLENEKGELRNTLNVDMNLWGDTNLVADLEFVDDYDREDSADGDHLTSRRGQITVNSQVSDELFVKGYVETIKNEDRSRKRTTDVNGRDVNRVGGEFTYSIEDDFSLKGYAEREEVEDIFVPDDDGTFDRFAGEVSYNFTRALKLRYVHGWQDLKYINLRGDFVVNNFAELKYKPTQVTEVLLNYGFEYEAGGGDGGPLVFDRTNKILQLSAQTNF
jgi:hypothetical protein